MHQTAVLPFRKSHILINPINTLVPGTGLSYENFYALKRIPWHQLIAVALFSSEKMFELGAPSSTEEESTRMLASAPTFGIQGTVHPRICLSL
jgi:hypothetical protein